MRQRVNIEELEQSTKIRAKYLRALENEEFGLLPGPTYVKSFLRTYAEKLGLDPQLLVEEFRPSYEPRSRLEQFQPLPPRRAGRDRRPAAPRFGGRLARAADRGGHRRCCHRACERGWGRRGWRAGVRDRPDRDAAQQPSRAGAAAAAAPAWCCGSHRSRRPTCAWTEAPDAGRLRGHDRRAADVPRKRLRINLGKRSAELRVNGEPVPFESGPEPIGFEFTPQREPEELPSVSGRATLRVSARAGIVVTGTEVLTGRVQDRNGPWLADRLLELGIELAHITICGDRPEDMEAQLRFMADEGVDLIITSGGLGPTADDLTAEVVGAFQGREMVLDEALEERIADILKPLMRRWRHLDFDAVRAANRKQAVIPEGSFVIDPAGTAPGRRRAAAARRSSCCPARRGSCTRCGAPPSATRDRPRGARRAHRLRAADAALFGIPESEIAETLRVAEEGIEGFEHLEITTCLRRGELEVVIRHEPATSGAYDALAELMRERHGRTSSRPTAPRSTIRSPSCSGTGRSPRRVVHRGLMAARLTDRPGSSGCVPGGVVAYSNEAKGTCSASTLR